MLGFATYTVAGSGPVDVTVPGLAIGADDGPTRAEVADALARADLVVVENLCSLPLNPAGLGRGRRGSWPDGRPCSTTTTSPGSGPQFARPPADRPTTPGGATSPSTS